jgi:hypothetical protein
MYGKQFIAALMFLAVAQVNGQEYDEEVDAAAAYEASPMPEIDPEEVELTDVTIPDGDWDVSRVCVVLGVVAEGDAVLDWNDGLPDDLAAYAATVDDYVLCVGAELDLQEGEAYALGLQSASQTAGILAIADGGFRTVYFDSADAEDGDDIEEPAWFSAEANTEDGFEDASGVGDVWGQDYTDGMWSLWSYNGEDGSESWGEDTYDFVWVESAEGQTVWSSFTDSFDLAASGAARLLATATTASLLLAMM